MGMIKESFVDSFIHSSIHLFIHLSGPLFSCLERVANESWVFEVERVFDGDDQRRNCGQNFGASMIQHVVDTLQGEETVRMLILAQS